MSSTFNIELTWLPKEDTKTPEIDATLCELSFTLEGEPILTWVDANNQFSDKRICTSAYPIAEWLAFNWWQLLYEPASPTSKYHGPARPYSRYHDLSSVGYGFVFPPVRIIPSGLYAEISIETHKPNFTDVQFTAQARSIVSIEHLEEVLREFLRIVDEKLVQHDVTSSPFQERYEALVNAWNNKDEMAFCIASGVCGLDPHDVDQTVANRIIELFNGLPDHIALSLLSSSDLSDIQGFTDVFNRQIEDLMQHAHKSRLSSIRKGNASFRREKPWNVGHSTAEEARQHLGLNGHSFESINDLLDVVDLSQSSLVSFDSSLVTNSGVQSFLYSSPDRSLGVSIDKTRHPDSQKFDLARAIGDYILSSEDSRITVQSHTDAQKANRAFAAEFLAPVSLINKKLGAYAGKVIPDDLIEEVASDLYVSSFVVKRQIFNYELGSLESNWFF